MDSDTESETVTIEERKFNGAVTMLITTPGVVKSGVVKSLAEEFCRDVRNFTPTRVVAELRDSSLSPAGKQEWVVMAADHSSGSLADTHEYEI